MTGVVRAFKADKGYGFIRRDDGLKPDVFVHYTGISASGFRSLEEGEHVEFDIVDEPRGPKAINVRKVEGAV